MEHKFRDITSAVFGGTVGINTIWGITYSKKVKMIKDSGDADKGITYLARGTAEIVGGLVIGDRVQAETLAAEQRAADFVFTGVEEATGRVKTVALKGCLFFDEGGTAVAFQAMDVGVADAPGS